MKEKPCGALRVRTSRFGALRGKMRGVVNIGRNKRTAFAGKAGDLFG